MRYRSNNGYGVPMVIRAPYGGGVHGALYHSQSVEAFFTHVPGLKVVIPSTPHDAKGLLRSSIRDEDPVLFFEHKKMYRSVRGDVPDTDYTVPLGVAKVTHPGSQVTVVAYGLMAHYALEAADRVAEEAFDYLDGPVTRIAGPDVPGVPYNHALEDWFMVNPEKIAAGVRKLAAY